MHVKPGLLLIFLACLTIAMLGCDSGNRDLTPTPESMPKQQPPSADMSGGPTPPPKVLPLKQAQAAYEAAAKGSDLKAKEEATENLADAYMWGDMPPKVKYRNALKYYREVLKLNPKNQAAKSSADTIIGIYHQMNLEVPGGG